MTNLDETEGPAAGSETEAAAASAMNDQITDALNQLHAILAGGDKSAIQAATYQTLVHGLALAMHNAVAEQQHNHILRMAMTTSAAKAILAGRKAEAEAILELGRTQLASSKDLFKLLTEFESLIYRISYEPQAATTEAAQAAARTPAGEPEISPAE